MYKLTTCLFTLAILLFSTYAKGQQRALFGKRTKMDYYILNANPQVVYAGKIKVRNKELIVKNSQGKDLKYKADEVYWAKADTIRYVAATNFSIEGFLGPSTQTNKSFVEIIDSGKVSLYCYKYSAAFYGSGYAGSTPGGAASVSTFMLHDAADNSITTLRASKGQRFRETVAPFVAARPDLLQLLEDGRITINNMPLLLHALNYGEPFPIKFKAKKVKEKVVEDPFGGN
jgi:hypothetical protein